MLFDECFDIILYAGNNPLLLDSCRPIKRVNCSRNVLAWSPVTIMADPFLVVNDETLYLFYEEYKYRGKGILMATSTNDLVNWSQPWVALEEDFHLSYPWVFQQDGLWYMIPETSAKHEIRLYKAVDNHFERFEFVKTLLAHDGGDPYPVMDYCDSSIVEKDGKFYLFTTLQHGYGNELHLFCSDALDGNYVPHPLSPVVVGDEYGRNGGHPLDFHGTLYRFAQDCCGEYGKDIHFFKINELSETRYQESLVSHNVLTIDGRFGGHQYNFVKFRDKFIIAVDRKHRIPFLACKVKRLFQLMKK